MISRQRCGTSLSHPADCRVSPVGLPRHRLSSPLRPPSLAITTLAMPRRSEYRATQPAKLVNYRRTISHVMPARRSLGDAGPGVSTLWWLPGRAVARWRRRQEGWTAPFLPGEWVCCVDSTGPLYRLFVCHGTLPSEQFRQHQLLHPDDRRVVRDTAV